MGAEAKSAECIGNAFDIGALQDRLLRVFARTEELAGHTGQNLKFGVAGAGTDDGHSQVSGRIILLQFMEKGDRIFGCLDKIRFADIEKRFQQHDDNIRSVLPGHRRRAHIGIFDQSPHGNRGITGRLGHAPVEHTGRKAVDIAVIEITLCEIAEVRGQHRCPDQPARHKRNGQEQGSDNTEPYRKGEPHRLLLAPAEQQHH